MMTDLTGSMYDIADYVEKLLKDNQEELGLADVFYGDQNTIPKTPTACVEPGTKVRELNGAPRRTLVTIQVYIILYHEKVASITAVRKDVDRLAETVEAKIHADAQMGGVVIHSLVSEIESGYQMRSSSLFRSSRLQITATSQEQLPSTV